MKTRMMLLVLGIMAIVLAVVLSALALFQKQPWDNAIWMICLAYLGGGLLLFAIRYLMGLAKSGRRQRIRATHTPYPPDSRSDEGMVLVLVLVLVGLMAGLTVHIQHAARIAQKTDQRLWQNARLRAALTDEAFRVLRLLAEDEEPAVDYLQKPLFAITETERPDGMATLSRVTDLNRYVDLNNLVLGPDFTGYNHTERMLVEAMTHAGDFTPHQRIEGLTDWIDADDEGIRETPFYMEQEPPHAVPNTWLQAWNELRWIDGFHPEYFEPKPLHVVGRPFSANFVELVTAVPGPRARPIPVNLNTAPALVLESVFGPEHDQIARYIYIARADRPFRSIEALLAQLDPGLFTELSPFIDVRSTHFLVDVQAYERGTRSHLRVVAERDRNGQVRILQWAL